MIYTPALQIIRDQGVLNDLERTEADLFVWVWRHSQELLQREGSAHLAQVAGQLTQSDDGDSMNNCACGSSLFHARWPHPISKEPQRDLWLCCFQGSPAY
jgi:hypothetical protein